MIELDGPQTAWFEYPDGTRETYTVYAYGSKHAGELVDMYRAWYHHKDEVYSQTRTLVWRDRPRIEWDSDLEMWKLRFRCVFAANLATVLPIPPKEEGVPIEHS